MAKIVEVTNPVTGQPAQVDQLDHTAQEIDDAIARALPGGAIDITLQKKVNPNLLDNPYFGNPIDQRGGYVVPPGVEYAGESSGTTTKYYNVKSTYIYNDVKYAVFDVDGSECNAPFYTCVRGYTGAGYGTDRWLMWGNSNVCLITESGIVTLDATGQTPWISQKFPAKFLLPGVYTISALFVSKIKSDSPRINFYCDGIGDLESISDTDDSLIVGTITIPESAKDKQMWVSFDCRNCDGLKAVKLELGTHQTIAHQDENGNWVLNEIPNYGEQLARCQRYQWIPDEPNNPDFLPRGVGVCSSAEDSRILYDTLLFPTTMRATPKITNVRIWDVTNWPYVEVAPENPSPPAYASKDGVYQLLLGNTQGIVTGHKYAVWFVAGANL